MTNLATAVLCHILISEYFLTINNVIAWTIDDLSYLAQVGSAYLSPRAALRQLSIQVIYHRRYPAWFTSSLLHLYSSLPAFPPELRHLPVLSRLPLLFLSLGSKSIPSEMQESVSRFAVVCLPTGRPFKCTCSPLCISIVLLSYQFSYDCNGTAAQRWVFTRNQVQAQIRLANTNFCLDAGDSK
jgi:hypothetical protein